MASSNLTKYCACHTKYLLKPSIALPENSRKHLQRHFQCATDPTMLRAGSGNETVIRNPPRNRGYFSRPPRAFCIENYNMSRSVYHSTFHRILRLPRKVTLQRHQIPCACHTKCFSHDGYTSQTKCYLQCAEQQVSSSNITKYCACQTMMLMIHMRHR